MSDHITLTGLRAFGYHGVLDHEKAQGQTFVVDVDITTDFAAAVASDNVADTVNYGVIAGLVVQTVAKTRFDLIESLADRLCRDILDVPRVLAVSVTVHKPSAPIDAEFADVSVTRRLP